MYDKLNYGKTEYLGTDHSEEFQTNGNTIPTVKRFKYLGSKVQENDSYDLDTEERISETRKVISMLNSVLWNRNSLHSTNLLICKSTVNSILTYGAETWSINRKKTHRLLATEIDYLRRSARISRMARVRNETIRTNMGMKKDMLCEMEEQ
jgi:phage gp16-like protein